MTKKKTTKAKEPELYYFKVKESGGLYVKALTLEPSKKGSYWDLVSAKKLPLYCVVRVEYTTGDSFSTSYGNICYLYLCDTLEEGLAVAQAIRDHDRLYTAGHFNGSKWETQFKLELTYKKKKINIGTSAWTGYFERLDGVDVVPIAVVE